MKKPNNDHDRSDDLPFDQSPKPPAITKKMHSKQIQSSPLSTLSQPSPISKGIINLCALLLLIITISGSSTLLTSPIHPIGLLLGILISAYLFLIFSLIRRHSIFSTVLFFLQKQFTKIQSQASKISPSTTTSALDTDPKKLLLLTKIIMHCAWSIIFVGLLIGLFFQFTLQQYQFNLYSTLFPYESGVYLQIIDIINYLPSIIFGELISEQLIINSLQGLSSPADNAIWARWILLMLTLYGLLPRIILSLFAYYHYRQYQRSTLQQPPAKTDSTILDPAIKQPISDRMPKTITAGFGERHIALDFAYPLNQKITIINDRAAFTAIKDQLTNAPLDRLTLYIDSSLTPDRSLLRRIYSLLNLSRHNTLILVTSEGHSRLNEWQQKIEPNLEPDEQIQTQSLSKLQDSSQ